MLRWWQDWRRRLAGSSREGGWKWPRWNASGDGSVDAAAAGQSGIKTGLLVCGAVLALLHLTLFPALPRIDLEMVIEPGFRTPFQFYAGSAFMDEPYLVHEHNGRILDPPMVNRRLVYINRQGRIIWDELERIYRPLEQ